VAHRDSSRRRRCVVPPRYHTPSAPGARRDARRSRAGSASADALRPRPPRAYQPQTRPNDHPAPPYPQNRAEPSPRRTQPRQSPAPHGRTAQERVPALPRRARRRTRPGQAPWQQPGLTNHPKPEDLLVPDARRSPCAGRLGLAWPGERIAGAIKPNLARGTGAPAGRSGHPARLLRPMTVSSQARANPTTIGLAARAGAHRGGYVVGWDDNRDARTLAVRTSKPRQPAHDRLGLSRSLTSFRRPRARVGAQLLRAHRGDTSTPGERRPPRQHGPDRRERSSAASTTCWQRFYPQSS